MKRNYGIAMLVLAAIINMGVAVAHLSCLFLGPECYAVQMAPPAIIESAEKGTLLAPVGNVIVSSLFVLAGLYALSGARIICRLPLLNLAIHTLSVLCVIRGLLPLQLWIRHPEKVSDAVLLAGVAWLITGLLYFFGGRAANKTHNQDISSA